MLGKLFDSAINTVGDFVDNPIGTSIDIAVQPVRDSLEVLQGLTEGELRERAALRLGADVVGGMALGEVVDFLLEG